MVFNDPGFLICRSVLVLFDWCELVFRQVLEGLLMLKNELEVQIDAHDTLWGETGTFMSVSLVSLTMSLFQVH